MISKEETFLPDRQEVRVVLRNELGHVVHDMTLPLVVDVQDEQGNVVGFKPYDIARDIDAAVRLHEDRHIAFVKAAQARGHLTDIKLPEGCGCP